MEQEVKAPENPDSDCMYKGYFRILFYVGNRWIFSFLEYRGFIKPFNALIRPSENKITELP